MNHFTEQKNRLYKATKYRETMMEKSDSSISSEFIEDRINEIDRRYNAITDYVIFTQMRGPMLTYYKREAIKMLKMGNQLREQLENFGVMYEKPIGPIEPKIAHIRSQIRPVPKF